MALRVLFSIYRVSPFTARTSFAMFSYRTPKKPVTLNAIPSLHDLYLKGDLRAKSENLAKKSHDVELNNLISLWKGDITLLEIDAIVNAANRFLLGGGGVDGAIHSAAGNGLLQECRKLGPCDTGDAKITQGYKLPAKHIIHTVGPMRTDEDALRSCYIRSLEVLTDKGLRTTAFPCISTGIYGYPNAEAANTALSVVRDWLEANDNRKKVDRIIFCLFMPEDVKLYKDLTPIYFPPKEDGDEAGTNTEFETKVETASSNMKHEREAEVDTDNKKLATNIAVDSREQERQSDIIVDNQDQAKLDDSVQEQEHQSDTTVDNQAQAKLNDSVQEQERQSEIDVGKEVQANQDNFVQLQERQSYVDADNEVQANQNSSVHQSYVDVNEVQNNQDNFTQLQEHQSNIDVGNEQANQDGSVQLQEHQSYANVSNEVQANQHDPVQLQEVPANQDDPVHEREHESDIDVGKGVQANQDDSVQEQEDQSYIDVGNEVQANLGDSVQEQEHQYIEVVLEGTKIVVESDILMDADGDTTMTDDTFVVVNSEGQSEEGKGRKEDIEARI